MNKRGITWEQIIYAIVAIIVLISLILLFRGNLSGVAEGFTNILKPSVGQTEDLGKQLSETLLHNKF